MRKISMILLSVMLLFSAAALTPAALAAGTGAYWICPDCGQEGNYDNYCPDCGASRPELPDPYENPGLIPGETEHRSVSVCRIDGSSWIAAKKNTYLYAPENAIDRDAGTCWQFSAKKGLKDKAWLSMIIEEGTVDGVWILNGFRSVSGGADQYPLYSRMKEIRLFFEYNNAESETMAFTLRDDSFGWEKLDTGRHEDVYAVSVFVDSVRKGTKHPDAVCLTEIMLVENTPAP